MRSDLLQLLDAFHWRYTFGPIREGALDEVNKRLLFVLSLFLLLALITLGVDYMRWGQWNQTVSLIPMIFFAGAERAAISLQNRLQQVPTSGDSIINLFALKHGRASLWLTPIMGALFALLAYLLFISGFVKGDLFPKIRIAEATPGRPRNYTSFGSYLYSMSPIDSLNFAKLLIFCFLAGFAERLIPGALDRLVVRNVNNLTNRMLTADSLKDMLTGIVAEGFSGATGFRGQTRRCRPSRTNPTRCRPSRTNPSVPPVADKPIEVQNRREQTRRGAARRGRTRRGANPSRTNPSMRVKRRIMDRVARSDAFAVNKALAALLKN